MEKKKVLILIGVPNFNYSNKQSAVLSYLEKIRIAFEKEGCEVEFSKILDVEDNVSPSNQTNGKGLKSLIKSILKKLPYIYHSMVLRAYFKAQNQLLLDLKKKQKPDLIVEFHSIGSTIGAELASFWNCNLSIIFDAPTDEQFFEMHQTKTVYWKKIHDFEKKAIESANRIMVYSDACQLYIEKKYSPKGAIEILPCVIHKSAISRNPAEVFTVGFIGSFLKWHKVDHLVLAFKEFRKLAPEAQLQLIGFGEEWQNVKDLVDQLELTQNIQMPGFVSEDELNKLKAELTVAIMPGSNWYGSPLKLFEYASAEIPFIAPSTPTVKYIFNKEHCRLLKEDDLANSITAELHFYYENRDERIKMGRSAHNYVEQEFNSKLYNKKLFVNLNC